MAITDLTGTTWEFDEIISLSQLNYYINFNSNNREFNRIFYDDGEGWLEYRGNTWSGAVYWDGWVSSAYRTITITGGTDATNATLIAWLENNATLISGGDTGTTFDLSTLSLSTGTHTITVKAKATGKKDSVASNVLNYEEPTTGYVASVVGLGNSSPSSVTITKDTGFPTTFEEVTLNGNIFVKFPTFYRKVVTVTNNQITAFNIATAKIDNTYEPYSVFVDPNGNVLPYVLIGKYASNSSSAMNSVSAGMATLTIGNARTLARNLGSGYQQYDWQFQKLFQDLALVISGNVNFNSGTTITNYLGIYDLARNIVVDGLAKDGTTWVCATNPANYVDNATSSSTGYTAVSYSAPSTNGEIQKLGYDSNSPFFNFPNAVVYNSSYNTYYCDVYNYGSGNYPVHLRVGSADSGFGLWFYRTDLEWSYTSGARLCYRPLP